MGHIFMAYIVMARKEVSVGRILRATRGGFDFGVESVFGYSAFVIFKASLVEVRLGFSPSLP